MMAFLAFAKKRLFPPVFTPHHRRLLASASASATEIPDPKSSSSFMLNHYLVSTFSIAPATAARISKPIAHLKSPLNPDAVHSFLQRQGFGDAEIKTIITKLPSILCSSPENTLAPNLLALRNTGLSASALTQIILSGPQALQLSSTVPRIKFWSDFVGGDEALLVKVFKRNRGLIGHDINGGIANKFLLLQSHGISIRDIQWIVCRVHCFIMYSVSTMEDKLKRVQDLGFQPGSTMFTEGLQAVAFLTREALQKKMELLKSFGWSKAEFFSALRKAPTMICLSEENLRAKMDFLFGEARLDVSYITSHPVLLKFSLEKRLRPRNHILRLLESENLSKKRKDFLSAIIISDKKFVMEYILPHKEELPELHDVYLAACA